MLRSVGKSKDNWKAKPQVKNVDNNISKTTTISKLFDNHENAVGQKIMNNNIYVANSDSDYEKAEDNCVDLISNDNIQVKRCL